jgi:hypothetical protein
MPADRKETVLLGESPKTSSFDREGALNPVSTIFAIPASIEF